MFNIYIYIYLDKICNIFCTTSCTRQNMKFQLGFMYIRVREVLIWTQTKFGNYFSKV
jgi:hypothetical protein